MTTDGKPPPKPPAQAERERRLAEALRRNLRLRKAAAEPARTPGRGKDQPPEKDR